MCYFRTRVSQMLAELVLHFSALCFSFFKTGENKPNKRKNGFPVGRLLVPVLRFPQLLCGIKI
jgi:hypothetical protein